MSKEEIVCKYCELTLDAGCLAIQTVSAEEEWCEVCDSGIDTEDYCDEGQWP